MTFAVEAADLLLLARSRHPTDRERLLVSIIDLCDRDDIDEIIDEHLVHGRIVDRLKI